MRTEDDSIINEASSVRLIEYPTKWELAESRSGDSAVKEWESDLAGQRLAALDAAAVQ